LNIFTKTLASILLIALFQGCDDNNEVNNSDFQYEKIEESKITQQTKTYKSVENLVSTTEYILNSVNGESISVIKEGSRFYIPNATNQLVLFDFFTTWCPACRSVAPHLANIQKKYPKELLVIGVLIEEDKSNEDVIKFKKRYKADYMISNSTNSDTNYANFKLSNSVASLLRQPRSFPIPLLVMFKNGEYFTHYVGAVPEEMIESDIKEALDLRGKK